MPDNTLTLVPIEIARPSQFGLDTLGNQLKRSKNLDEAFEKMKKDNKIEFSHNDLLSSPSLKVIQKPSNQNSVYGTPLQKETRISLFKQESQKSFFKPEPFSQLQLMKKLPEPKLITQNYSDIEKKSKKNEEKGRFDEELVKRERKFGIRYLNIKN